MTKLTYNVIMLYNIDKKLSFKFLYLDGFLLRWLVLNIYSPMNVKFARALSFGKYGLL
ncbi:MAG: hypothetical protein SPH83_12085 [Treponema sp.]|nr:hypothetical protein [Treponema sp.]